MYCPSSQPSSTTRSEQGTSWIKWMTLLQMEMTDRSTDTLTRCSLVSLRVHSQILRMSERLIASQALDHASFLQELWRPHACKEH